MWPISKRNIHTNGELYLTRYSCAFLPKYFLHVFHRGDNDPDPHDHPWNFTTFPLVAYVEEVWEYGLLTRRVVSTARWHQREATYCHRVLGPHWQPHIAEGGPSVRNVWNVVMPRVYLPWYTRLCWWWFGPDKIVTVVKHGDETRKWGFRKRAVVDGVVSWVWVPWRQYVERAKTWME